MQHIISAHVHSCSPSYTDKN